MVSSKCRSSGKIENYFFLPPSFAQPGRLEDRLLALEDRLPVLMEGQGDRLLILHTGSVSNPVLSMPREGL